MPKLATTKLLPATQSLVQQATQQELILWASVCAEHVLNYFEMAFPQDTRPREAIDAARAWAQGDLKMSEARKAAFAAHAAARQAEPYPAAQSAARAAGHAAATAHMTRHADKAAIYAATAARDAASLEDKEDAATQEFEWQHQQLILLGEQKQG